MFVIESGSIDWARLRIVSIKDGEIEDSGRALLRAEGQQFVFICNQQRGEKGNGIMVRRTRRISYGPNHSWP